MEPALEIERERFYSRLATISGLNPLPSIGSWILLQVEAANDLARKVNRRMAPGVVSVPRNVAGAVRVPVRTPKENEEVFRTIRELMERRQSAGAATDDEIEDVA